MIYSLRGTTAPVKVQFPEKHGSGPVITLRSSLRAFYDGRTVDHQRFSSPEMNPGQVRGRY